jgi:hypothetical protein
MSAPSVFSPRLLLTFVALAAGLFALSIYLVAFGVRGERSATGPSTYSRSAIGYAGLAELLRRLGITVVQDREQNAGAIRPTDLVVVTEPPVSSAAEETRLVPVTARQAIVVLPKWQGFPDSKHSGWIGEAVLKPAETADWVVSLTGARGRTVRVPRPQAWSVNALGAAPQAGQQVQLLTGSDLTPVVAAPEGILVGDRVVGGQQIRIVADPDVLSNHGIVHEANARFARALVMGLSGPRGRAIFDETVHGFRAPGLNPLRLPFEAPFHVVTALTLGSIALMLWASAARFGRPLTAPPILQPGKQMLIRNASRLIALGGRGEPIVAAYVEATIRDVGHRLHAPARLDAAGLVAWLDRTARARGVESDLNELVRRTEALRIGARADARMLVRVAADAHRWKQEMLNES